MHFEPRDLWAFLPLGYALTVAIELPILLAGLSPRHGIWRRIFAGFWLTACTYPIVVLVLPPLVGNSWGKTAYLVVAETFAPAAECLLFWALFGRGESGATQPGTLRDMLAIVAANLASFLLGGWVVSRVFA
jgi:hypothetical protein